MFLIAFVAEADDEEEVEYLDESEAILLLFLLVRSLQDRCLLLLRWWCLQSRMFVVAMWLRCDCRTTAVLEVPFEFTRRYVVGQQNSQYE